MRSFACVLSILLCSQVALLASAEDNDDGMRRLVRNRNQASQVAMSVSASGDASEVSESMMELQDAVQVSSAVQDILDEVEEMARSGAHVSGDKIKVIKDIVEGELLPDLKATHKAAETQVGVNKAAIDTCNKNMTTRTQEISSSTKVSVGTSRTEHAECRKQEAEHKNTKTARCQELDDFLNGIGGFPSMPDPKGRDAMVQYVETMSEYFCPKGPTATKLDEACTASTNVHSGHRAKCNKLQATFEIAFCTWRTQLIDRCSAQTQCYDNAKNTFDTHVAATKTLVKKWKVEWAALKKILCYTNVWLSDSNVKTVSAGKLAECESTPIVTDESSPMHINFPEAPAKATCSLTEVAKYPGTPAFVTAEYSQLQDVGDAIPCPGTSTGFTTSENGPKPIEIKYVAEFTQGHVSKDSQQCKDWQSLHQKVDTGAGYITVSVGDQTRTCKDDTIANQILSHFASKDKSRKSYKCGGHTWFVGNCAAGSHLGLEICVDCPKICHCSGDKNQISLRPCINNRNWGGHGHTCGSTKKATMSLTTKAKVEPSMIEYNEIEDSDEGDDSWMHSSDPALIE
jgi:hypothetical protein